MAVVRVGRCLPRAPAPRLAPASSAHRRPQGSLLMRAPRRGGRPPNSCEPRPGASCQPRPRLPYSTSRALCCQPRPPCSPGARWTCPGLRRRWSCPRLPCQRSPRSRASQSGQRRCRPPRRRARRAAGAAPAGAAAAAAGGAPAASGRAAAGRRVRQLVAGAGPQPGQGLGEVRAPAAARRRSSWGPAPGGLLPQLIARAASTGRKHCAGGRQGSRRLRRWPLTALFWLLRSCRRRLQGVLLRQPQPRVRQPGPSSPAAAPAAPSDGVAPVHCSCGSGTPPEAPRRCVGVQLLQHRSGSSSVDGGARLGGRGGRRCWSSFREWRSGRPRRPRLRSLSGAARAVLPAGAPLPMLRR
jgi:hypothetical protein